MACDKRKRNGKGLIGRFSLRGAAGRRAPGRVLAIQPPWSQPPPGLPLRRLDGGDLGFRAFFLAEVVGPAATNSMAMSAARLHLAVFMDLMHGV